MQNFFHPAQVEPWSVPLWPSRNPVLCRPRLLPPSPTGGHTLCPTCPPSALRLDPLQGEARPSDELQARTKQVNKILTSY